MTGADEEAIPTTDLDRAYAMTDGVMSAQEADADNLRELLKWATRNTDLNAAQSAADAHYFARIRAAISDIQRAAVTRADVEEALARADTDRFAAALSALLRAPGPAEQNAAVVELVCAVLGVSDAE